MQVLSKEASSTIFESLVYLDLGLNPGLPGYWRTFSPLGQWAGILSPSSRGDCMHSHDSLLLSVLIGHHSWLVLYTTSSVRTKLMYVSFCLSADTGVSMYWTSQDNITYEVVIISPACLIHYLRWFMRWEVNGRIAAVI